MNEPQKSNFLRQLGRMASAPLSSDVEMPAFTQLGKYHIIKELARGAMGVVYEAEDIELKRPAAVKILKELAGAHEVGRHRFQREAITAARLSHPNVVQVYDAGEEQGRLYLAMELVRGRPLGDAFLEKPRNLRRLLILLEKASRGVAAAHAIGVVHRDVKPANILVTEAGEPKVGDFGLAHWMDSDTQLTKSGTPLGTPMYMAPEQIRGSSSEISPAADVFALGAILYEILTGQPPHKGENTAEIYGKILNEDAMLPRRIDTTIPRELETVVLKAIDKEPSRRYPNAAEFADDLKRWLEGEPVRARPVSALGRVWRRGVKQRRILLPAAIAVAIAGGGWALTSLKTAGQKVELDHAKVREQAARLVEDGRPALDRAVLYLYRPDANYDALVRQVDEGQQLIDRAIAISPDFAVAHYLQGLAWEIKGWDEKAEASWREAIRLDKDYSAARYRLGHRLMVRAFLERIADRADEGPARQARMDAWINEAIAEIEAASGGRQEGEMLGRLAAAMHAYLKKDLEKARSLSEEAITKYKGAPGAEEFYWIIGISVPYTDPRRIGAFSDAIKERPNYALALFCRASEYVRDGRYDEGIPDLDHALKLHPRFKQAWLNRGLAYSHKSVYDRAISDFNEVIKLDPAFPMALTNRSTCYAEQGDIDAAIADCLEALRINPTYSYAYLNLSICHEKRGEMDAALADFDRGIQLAGESVFLVSRRGDLNRRLKRWSAAVADYRKALEMAAPGSADRAKLQERLDHARSNLEEQ